MKYIICILFFFSFIKGETHLIFFKGIEVGTIQNFNNQISVQNYILADISKSYFKYLFFSNNFVIFKETKPTLINTYFKQNDNLISLLNILSKNKNGIFMYKNKKLISNCQNSYCFYEYYSFYDLKIKGFILLNEKQDIDIIFDEINNISISLN